MGIQVISRDGQPEYAVVPWEQYQALLKAAGQAPAEAVVGEPAMAAAAAQAIELPDHEHVTLTQDVAQLGQTGTLESCAACLILEYLLTPGLGQGLALQFKALVLCGDACVANEHGVRLFS